MTLVVLGPVHGLDVDTLARGLHHGAPDGRGVVTIASTEHGPRGLCRGPGPVVRDPCGQVEDMGRAGVVVKVVDEGRVGAVDSRESALEKGEILDAVVGYVGVGVCVLEPGVGNEPVLCTMCT